MNRERSVIKVTAWCLLGRWKGRMYRKSWRDEVDESMQRRRLDEERQKHQENWKGRLKGDGTKPIHVLITLRSIVGNVMQNLFYSMFYACFVLQNATRYDYVEI